MCGIKIEIKKSALTKGRQLNMLFGALRGGIYNAIYGFNGVSGKNNKTMFLQAKTQGNIKMWFRDKTDRDEAFLFCESILRQPNPFSKRISRICKKQRMHLSAKRINREHH